MTVVLRRAVQGDSDLLFEWVNRSDSLVGKLLTVGPIPLDRHEAWLAARLADPETFLWIIESNQKPVGQLRLVKNTDAYEVDIYVVSDQRHVGVALAALAIGINTMSEARGGKQTMRARVKIDNASSQHLFERAGFVLTARNSDHLVYDLKKS